MNVKKNRIEFSLTENEKDALTRVLELLDDIDGLLYAFNNNFGNFTISTVDVDYDLNYDEKISFNMTTLFLETLLNGAIYIDTEGNENETI